MKDAQPIDTLVTAIGIFQAHVLASDSMQSGTEEWGTCYMKAAGVEHAIRLLIDLIEPVELASRGEAA